jgi:hypothetical protein
VSDKPIHAEVVRADQIRVGDQIRGKMPQGNIDVTRVQEIHGTGFIDIYQGDTIYRWLKTDEVARVPPPPVEVRDFWRCSYEWKRATADFRIEWTKSVYTFQSRCHAEEKLDSAWRTHANGPDGIKNQTIEHVRETVLSREEVQP